MKANSDQTSHRRQRLTSLLILAFSLVVLGAYTSHQSLRADERAVAVEQIKLPPPMHSSVLDAIPSTLSNSEFHDGVELHYRPENTQYYEMWMHQQNEYEEFAEEKRTIETILNVSWRDVIQDSAVPERLDIIRDFEKASIEVREQDELVGVDIAHQLALVLSDTKTRIVMSDRGLVKSKQWTPEMNAQTAQTLYLLDDASRLINPHFLREAVHIGEDWTYWLRTTAENENSNRLEASGSYEVSNRIEGMMTSNNRDYAVIVQEITGSVRGTIDETTRYVASGQGRGLVLFDVERGILYSSQIEFERTITLDEKQNGTDSDTISVQTSKIRLYLVQRKYDRTAIQSRNE